MLRKSLCFCIIFLLGSMVTNAQSLIWSTPVDSVATFSSPRAVKLNGDAVLDIVVGAGHDATASNHGVQAFDGATGALMWETAAIDDIFGTPVFQDITGDNVPDVFISGRHAQFYAIDGSNGAIIWEFFPYTTDPADSGWYNFYTPQLIPDQNSDNLLDLLVANGGDHAAPPWDTIRDPGHIMVLDAYTGLILAKAATPDSMETYCSPVVSDLAGNGVLKVIFGTGGETLSGSMWMADLSNDLMNNDLSAAIQLAYTPDQGFVAPPAIADLNQDNVYDIVAQAYNGTAFAIDGSTFATLWSVNIPGTESSTEPVIGNFTGYTEPDVFLIMNKGSNPSYFDHYQILIDGATGQIAWMDSISDVHFATPNAFDANGNGRDEVLVSVNYAGASFSHELLLIDFQNDTVTNFWGPEPGFNLASTPLVMDLDYSGFIDVAYSYRTDSVSPFLPNGIRVNRLSTTIPVPAVGIAWGGYIGTNYNGHYNYTGGGCTVAPGAAVNQPSCNYAQDGSIFLNPAGGTAPYTYVWSDGSIADSLIGLGAGTYDATITDALGCTYSGSVTLIDPYVITFGAQTSNPCVGDSLATVTVNSSGCPCMFSGCIFDWSGGDSTKTAAGLEAGWHFITITHTDGCVTVDSVLIAEGLPLIDSMAVQHLDCIETATGSISLFANDTVNTTYSWSNGDTTAITDSLALGIFYVNISDARPCYDSIAVEILSPDTLWGQATSTNALCFGDSTGTISASGTGGTGSHQFVLDGTPFPSGSFANLPAGTYAVMVQDSLGCFSDPMNIVITEPNELMVTMSATHESDIGMNDGSATAAAAGGTTPYFYAWDDPSSQTTSTASNLSTGTYLVIVTDSAGCVVSDTISLGVLTSTNGIEESVAFSIYPNPVTDQFVVKSETQATYQLLLYDVGGKLVRSIEKTTQKELVVYREALPTGIYQLRLVVEGQHYDMKLLFD